VRVLAPPPSLSPRAALRLPHSGRPPQEAALRKLIPGRPSIQQAVSMTVIDDRRGESCEAMDWVSGSRTPRSSRTWPEVSCTRSNAKRYKAMMGYGDFGWMGDFGWLWMVLVLVVVVGVAVWAASSMFGSRGSPS
jgi:hypothetical protein